MRIPQLDEATIREHTEEGSLERGRRYLEAGKVRHLERDAKGRIEAQVQGSQLVPYTVTIRYDGSGVTSADCSCPYHGGSWCKHIAATLLATLQKPEEDVQESVRAMVERLSREELVELFDRLAVREPRIAEWIEKEVPPRAETRP